MSRHRDICMHTYIRVVGKNNPERIGELEAFNRELCTSRLMLRRDEISGRWHIKDFSFTTSLFDRGCVFIVNDTNIHSLRLSFVVSAIFRDWLEREIWKIKERSGNAREQERGKASHVALSHVSSLKQQRETFWCLVTRFSRHVFAHIEAI